MTLAATGLFLALPCAPAFAAITPADQNFILAVAQGGMTEVELGRMAARGGERQDVEEFGRMMVKDHSAINQDLIALASEKGVTLPDRLDADHQRMVDKFVFLSGANFDDAYICAMAKAHKMDAKAFITESEATTDSDIRSFVDKSLPVVQMHLDHLKDMRK